MKKPTQISAIDIGSSKITTIIASVGEEDQKVRVVGVASVPSRGIRKSQIVDIEEAIEAVTESVEAAERMAGFSISQALVSISGIHINSLNSKGLVAVQNPDAEIIADDVARVVEAAKAVPLDSTREILHVIPRYFIVDNQEGIKDPVGMSGVRLEVDAHIITGSSTNIKNLVKVVSEIGVDTRALVFAGLASAEAVLTETEKELGVILVDLGGGTSSVCIYADGSLSHSAVIPVGARNITNDIAIGLRVSLDTAEKIKRILAQEDKTPAKALDPKNPRAKKKRDEIDLYKLGIKDGPRKISRKAVMDGIVKPRLNEILDLIKAEVKKSGLGNQTPAGIVFTGGGALTYNLQESARRYLGLQARIAVPKKLTGLIDEINTPEYATATGLILYAVNHELQSTSGVFHLASMPSLNFSQIGKKLLNFIKSFLP